MVLLLKDGQVVVVKRRYQRTRRKGKGGAGTDSSYCLVSKPPGEVEGRGGEREREGLPRMETAAGGRDQRWDAVAGEIDRR